MHNVRQLISIVALVLVGLMVRASTGADQGVGDGTRGTPPTWLSPRGSLGSESALKSLEALGVASSVSQMPVTLPYANLPLRFEANRGQTDTQVQFFTRGNRYILFLTATEAVLVLLPHSEAIDSVAAQVVLRMQLLGANLTPQITGVEELPGANHYFIGNDPQQWRTHVPAYTRVEYEAVYPGIDLVYYGNQGQLEYDFLVAPGADPQAITLSFTGTDVLEINPEGALVLALPGGQVRMQPPIIYQEHEGIKRRIAGAYVRRDTHQVGFALGTYDPTHPLVIDPVLVYATFLGGSNHDAGLGIAVDAEGMAYVTGMTASLNFPSATREQSVPGGSYDAFVVKLSPDGAQLVYATYLGGSGDENMYEGLAYGGIAVDTTGAAYITGSTTSRDFPTVQALQPAHGGSRTDAFVAKLSPDGARMVYATYLGGSGIDMGRSIAVDAAGAAYLTGQNESEDFPTLRSFQPTHGGFFKDAFVTKIDATGSQLVYSSHLGGNQGDLGFGIAVDTAGHAYVYGETGSPNFPTTPGVFDTACGTDGHCNGGGDLFITKVSATGETLVYSTYLGGSGEDRIAASHGITVAPDGGVSVTGHTRSADFPNTYGQRLNGPSDAFVARLNPQGTALVYGVFLGGAGDDQGYAIAVDLAHNAYITGGTGGNFPTTTETYRCGDPSAFITKLRADGSTAYALCLSGHGVAKDRGHDIAVDPLGNAYVTGFTASPDFPTVNPAQPVHGGLNDAFVVKITDSLASIAIERKYRELGGLQGLLGVPVTDQLGVPDGVGQRRHFQHGSIYWHPDTGAWAVRNGPFWDKWTVLSWEQGRLGYPMTDQLDALDGVGQRQRFQHGYIYWHPETGPQVLLTTPLGRKWQALGWERGVLGYPVTDELLNPDGVGWRQHYQHGHIYWSPTTGAAALLTGPIGQLWEVFGWERGVLGYPVTDELVTPDRVGRYLQFQYGDIYWSSVTGPAAVLYGPFGDKWGALGREQGVLGYPVTNERVTSDGVGRLQLFQYGEIIWGPETDIHAVMREPFGKIWADEGWEQGTLGYPVTDEYHAPSCGPDGRRMDFTGGDICWTPAGGPVIHRTYANACVPDVVGQFLDLKPSAADLAVWYKTEEDSDLTAPPFPENLTIKRQLKGTDKCHIQGVQRLHVPGYIAYVANSQAHGGGRFNECDSLPTGQGGGAHLFVGLLASKIDAGVDAWGTNIPGDMHSAPKSDRNVLHFPLSRHPVDWQREQAWEIIDGTLTQVAAGCNETVLGVNAQHEIWHWQGKQWTRFPGALKQIAVNCDLRSIFGNIALIWGIDTEDKIWYWLPRETCSGAGCIPPGKWKESKGTLKQVAVGCDGTVWGVNAQDEIWHWREGDKWERIKGSLQQVAVGHANNVWGVNAQDEIWHWRDGQWEQIEGSLRQVAVGCDGTVWGVNAQDEIWHRRDGQWEQIRGSLPQIAVGDADHVWGVNAREEVYRYRHVFHPGGFQVAGDFLYVGIDGEADGSFVRVLDMTAPEQPQNAAYIDTLQHEDKHKVQTLGVVMLADGKLLMVVGKIDDKEGSLYFYKEMEDATGRPIRHKFIPIGEWKVTEQPAPLEGLADAFGVPLNIWRKEEFGFKSYQSTNLIRECGTNRLYMLGIANPGDIRCGGKAFGDDPTHADLYEVLLPDDASGLAAQPIKLTKVVKRTFGDYGGAGCAGTGVYINTHGRLSVYLMAHEGRRKKTGPLRWGARGVVPFYEFSAPE